jgi:hypothetical protein
MIEIPSSFIIHRRIAAVSPAIVTVVPNGFDSPPRAAGCDALACHRRASGPEPGVLARNEHQAQDRMLIRRSVHECSISREFRYRTSKRSNSGANFDQIVQKLFGDKIAVTIKIWLLRLDSNQQPSG